MSFDGFETLEIECDAPPYPIVQACRSLGFRAPEDVQWCRASRLRPNPPLRPEERLLQLLRSFFHWTEPKLVGCACRRRLPHLEHCTFTLAGGRTRHLFLGQCGNCQTMFWEQA